MIIMRIATAAGLSILMATGMTACATNPQAEYQTTLKSRESSSPSDVAVAANAVTPHSLTKGERFKFALDTGDPVVTIDGMASFYEVFRINGLAGQPMTVKTFSFVKGIGFDKYVVWPRVFFVDSTGSIVNAVPSDGRVSASLGGLGALQWECTWSITPPEDGDYRVLVTSDNRVLDQEIATDSRMLFAGAVFFPWTFGYLAHTTGEMAITWK